MKNKSNILLDLSLGEFIDTSSLSNIEIKKVRLGDENYFFIDLHNKSLEDICQLGGKIFYKIFRSNGNMINKYIESFVSNLKSINAKYQVFNDLSGLEFDVCINYDHLEFEVVNHYNRHYLTKFSVFSIDDNDGLDYARIKIEEANLLDVFCLGFMVCQDDLLKIEKMKPK